MTLPVVIPLAVPFSVRVVNAYVLIGDPLTVVDPGADWEDTESMLDAALAAHGARAEDVDRIVITHQHHDHAGFAHRLQARSGADVVAHGLLGRYLAGLAWDSMEAEDGYQADVMRLHGVPEATIAECYEHSKANRGYAGSIELDRPVREGDVVEAGGHRLVVHERPGHSPSDLLFVDEEGRFVLVGDHLIAGISPNPVVHRPLDRPADPRRRAPALVDYLASLRRTAELDVELMLPGHGPPIDDHRRLIEERLEFHDRRKERILAALPEPGCTARELAEIVWGDAAVREPFLTLSETLGHLDLLEQEGRVQTQEPSEGPILYLPA